MIGNFRQALTLLLLTLSTTHLGASETARSLKTSVSIIDQWTDDQHLYVDGDLKLAPTELADLEKWLDQAAPNWTVLLAENSRDERYRSAFGHGLRGLDAVEEALTNGLQAKTNFGELRNPKTRLLNGAVFILFLNEKKFSYFGGEHYSRNGASPKRFAGTLDGEARKAMRDGGRIVDAVKNTITLIDKKVRDTLTARERSRLTQIEEAKQEVKQLQSRLVEVSEKHAFIVSDLKAGNGDINRFPLTELKAQLSSIEDRPGTHDPDIVRQHLDRWEGILNRYRADEPELAKLEKKLANLSPTSPQGKSSLDYARVRLASAQKDYEAGNFSYRQTLANAQNSAAMVSMNDREGRRSAEKKNLAIKVGSASGVGGLFLLGLTGNRRRRRIKVEAEKLLASRKLEMRETEKRLFELMDRSDVIVGPFNELENRGYSGDTLALSKNALKHIDEAFVLSSNVQKIIEEGEALIEPGSPLSRSRNFISSGRYERAVDLLDAELNVGRRIVPTLKERTRPGEEVDETFSVPIDEWETRTTQTLDAAAECLDRVESSWATIVSRSETLEKNIDVLTARQDEIQVDECLRCDLLFDEWIPTIADRADRAALTGKSDPVRALDGDLNDGDRMADEAHTLLDLIAKFRTQHWADLEKNEATLDQHKRATLWIDSALSDHGKESDQIATDSPDGAVSGRLSALTLELEALAKRVSEGAALAVRADDKTQPAIKSATQLVETARREIAKSLKLEAGEILTEAEDNPSDILTKAHQQQQASLAALDLGDVTSAEGFLNEVDSLTTHAASLVTRARHVLADYEMTSEQLWKTRGALEERGNRMTSEVEAMRTRYAPRALFLDPEAPETGTFANAPQQLEGALKKITSRLDRAKTNFHSGALLEAWDLLENGQLLAHDGQALCEHVTKRSKKLGAMEEGNAAKNESHIRAEADLRGPVSDRRVTSETVQLFELIGTGLTEVEKEIEADDGRRDPFLVEDQLEKLSERLPILRKAISEDLEQHARALQLIDTVSRNQQEAAALWEKADGDRIPNSPKTNKTMTMIEECHANLEKARQALEKDHADWREIQNELRAVHLKISEAGLDLKKELKLALEAVRALEAATREVRKADRWSGSFGIRITENYGGRSLAAANDGMQHGLYQEALQMSGQARTRARSAIAHAEAREAAKRRAKETARQRRRQAATRSSFENSSMGSRRSGGRSFSSSSSSRSSSMGRSSFSSGSRAGRSGW
jgi:hypothetical protein